MRGVCKGVVFAGPVTASAAFVLVVGAVLPPRAAWVVLAVLVGVTLLALLPATQGAALRVLMGARPLTGEQWQVLAPALTRLCGTGIGPPAVAVYVARLNDAPTVLPMGARGVLVSRALIDQLGQGWVAHAEVAAALTHSAAVVRAGLTRSDLALLVWALPALQLAQLPPAFLHALAGPAGTAGWRGRGVLALIAAAQLAALGAPGISAFLVALTALSYGQDPLLRRWHTRLARTGDAHVAAHGLGPDLARYLTRYPGPHQDAARIRALTRSPTLKPSTRSTPSTWHLEGRRPTGGASVSLDAARRAGPGPGGRPGGGGRGR